MMTVAAHLFTALIAFTSQIDCSTKKCEDWESLRAKFSHSKTMRVKASQSSFVNVEALHIPEDVSNEARSKFRNDLDVLLKDLSVKRRVTLIIDNSNKFRIRVEKGLTAIWDGVRGIEFFTEGSTSSRRIHSKDGFSKTGGGWVLLEAIEELFPKTQSEIRSTKATIRSHGNVLTKTVIDIDDGSCIRYVLDPANGFPLRIEYELLRQAPLSDIFGYRLQGPLAIVVFSDLSFELDPVLEEDVFRVKTIPCRTPF